MNYIDMEKRFLFIIISLFVIFSYPLPCYPYAEKTHGKATREAALLVEKSDRDKLYEELYDKDNMKRLIKGSRDEDFTNVEGNNRSFRHYYEPDIERPEKGLKYFDYYKAWMYFDIVKNLGRVVENEWDSKWTQVREPEGGYYCDALEWARNSGGAADLMNWQGALMLYGYTEGSRATAYECLGHVTHLVSDMAQPDHALNYPHPGSSYRYPPEGIEGLSDSVYYGFEALVETYLPSLRIAGAQVRKRDSLDTFFNEMARLSKKAVEGRFSLPLGLDFMTFSFEIPGIGKVIEAQDVAIMPNIDDNNPQERSRYLGLARRLLTYSVELNAGLLEHFHDIVNQPPYVKQVVISQDGKQLYKAYFEEEFESVDDQIGELLLRYDKLRWRRLRIDKDMEIESGKEAIIRIEFGPDARTGERIDPQSVRVFLADLQIEGEMLDARTWQGSFIYTLKEAEKERELTLKIEARDLHNHFSRPGLPGKGYELDSDPRLPARLEDYTPPYPWQDYEPGADTNHRITVRAKLPPAVVESLSLKSADGSRVFLQVYWRRDAQNKTSQLIEDTDIESGGVNNARTRVGILRIGFDREIDEETLLVKLGDMQIKMLKIGDKAYEGRVYFSRLGGKGLDDIFTFSIQARTEEGILLDGNPASYAWWDSVNNEWVGYEPGPDNYHRIRVYHKAIQRPVVRGYVYFLESYKNFSGHLLQDWYPEPSVMYPYFSLKRGRPLEDYHIFWVVTYVKLADQRLFSEFERLIQTRIAILRKLQRGIRKISKAEFKAYERLLELKPEIYKRMKIEVVGKPGWTTTTNASGEFEIPLEKTVGEDGIIHMQVSAVAFPPFDVPSKEEANTFIATSTTQGWNSFNKFYDALLRIKPSGQGLEKEISLAERRIALQEQRQERLEEFLAIRQRLRELKKQWQLFDRIEKTWQERARRDQRTFQEQFKREHGPSEGWDEQTRREYMDKMSAIADKSRREWESEFKQFQRRRDSVFALAEAELQKAKDAFERVKQELRRVSDEIRSFIIDTNKRGFDLVLDVGRINETPRVYSVRGVFKGRRIELEGKPGECVAAYLIRQNSSDPPEDKELWARYNNRYEKTLIDLSDKNHPQPPYSFYFDKPLAEHLVIYETFSLPFNEIRLGPVKTIPYSARPGVTFSCIWESSTLPWMLEVEGYPVRDRARFNELWEEAEQIQREAETINIELKKMIKDLDEGRITLEDAYAIRQDLYNRRVELNGKWRSLIPQFAKINPIRFKNPNLYLQGTSVENHQR